MLLEWPIIILGFVVWIKICFIEEQETQDDRSVMDKDSLIVMDSDLLTETSCVY